LLIRRLIYILFGNIYILKKNTYCYLLGEKIIFLFSIIKKGGKMVRKNQEVDYKKLWYVSIMSIFGVAFLLFILYMPLNPNSMLGKLSYDGNMAGQAFMFKYDGNMAGQMFKSNTAFDGGVPPPDRIVVDGINYDKSYQIDQTYERETGDRTTTEGAGTGFGSGSGSVSSGDGDGDVSWDTPPDQSEDDIFDEEGMSSPGVVDPQPVSGWEDFNDLGEYGSRDNGPVSGFINPVTGEFVSTGGSNGMTEKEETMLKANLGFDVDSESGTEMSDSDRIKLANLILGPIVNKYDVVFIIG
jgi:hypothetical protein